MGWEIDGDASDLIYVSREEAYPYRLIITEEQADKLKKSVIWEMMKKDYKVIAK